MPTGSENPKSSCAISSWTSRKDAGMWEMRAGARSNRAPGLRGSPVDAGWRTESRPVLLPPSNRCLETQFFGKTQTLLENDDGARLLCWSALDRGRRLSATSLPTTSMPPARQRLDSWLVARTDPDPSHSYSSVAQIPPMTAVPSVTRVDEADTAPGRPSDRSPATTPDVTRRSRSEPQVPHRVQ